MMKLIQALLIVSIVGFNSCAISKKAANEYNSKAEMVHDGKSKESAVIIMETHENQGIKLEYQWIRANCTDYRIKGQALLSEGNRYFDKITIILKDGTTQDYFFDITNFYGKF